MKLIDLDRPLRTRDNRYVQVFCDGNDVDWPIKGTINGHPGMQKWRADGSFYADGECDMFDLINVGDDCEDKEELQVGEMYVETGLLVDGRAQFELVQAIEVTDDIRDLLTEAGYDTTELY